jgi:glycosyltransferase involved in cell wall biosynthesis
MRVLIISRHFPKKQSTWSVGVYKRFKMFVDAIKDISEIDLLYYVTNGVSTSPSEVHKKESDLSKFFEAPIRLFLCKKSDNRAPISKLSKYAFGTFIFYRQPLYSGINSKKQLQAFETCLSYNPDAVFVHRLGSMCPILRTRRVLPPIFFDLDDIEHIAFKRGIRYIRNAHTKLLNYFLIPALFWGEYRSVRLSKKTFVCSEGDRRILTDRFRLKGVVAIPNAVKIPESQPKTLEETLLFIGSYFHKPNIDAVEFLIKQIWPHVHKAIPTATLIIAGSPADKIPSYRRNIQGVRYTGFVENLDSLYRQSRVVCAPILSGSGTRVKIIEAAAYGKPIVSTRIGAEGLEMRPGQDILIHDNPKRFAEACVMLLRNADRCDYLGSSARNTVKKQYDQVKIKGMIQKFFEYKINEI